MHMSDALLSPVVGGTMWAASAGAVAYCSAKVRAGLDERRVPLMGVLGAFIFAAQMINFSIPATGSSGHLGGGLLLAILLGPHAAFLTTASVLVVQALFFADGGLLALGCNIFNLGFFPAFIAYPLIYRRMVGEEPSPPRIAAAAVVSAVAGLQMGAFGVVLETVCSGISSLPFATFAAIMQPIHLAIGIVEGVATAAVVSFAFKARPEIVRGAPEARPAGNRPLRRVLLAFLVAALFTGGVVSRFASKDPDGLEWSIARITGKDDLKGPGRGVHTALAALQEKAALFPGYAFAKPAAPKKDGGDSTGTSVAGIVGGAMTLAVAFLSALLLKKRNWAA
ncbi:MAG TPA: energy-coupling factor ABC transporter permease [Geobacteraceae bacterium]